MTPIEPPEQVERQWPEEIDVILNNPTGPPGSYGLWLPAGEGVILETWKARRYVPASQLEGLVSALEEIVAVGSNHPSGNFRYADEHVNRARSAIATYKGEQQ